MTVRVRRAVRRRVLGALSDEAVAAEFARRLKHRGGENLDLLVGLARQLSPKIAADAAERMMPVRELDYPRHRIELVVSGPGVVRRLRPTEKEPFTVEWIERSVRPGDVFYDVGANVGAYSLIAAKVTSNRARIFAFEPSAATFHDLSRNILHNGCQSVVPLSVALWSETGLLSFELHSLSAGAARHRINAEPGSEPSVTQTILGVRLDDLVEGLGVPAPTHAKIDVDRYELEVLRGAERTLDRAEWRSIILELDPEETDRNREITSLLAGHGFVHGRRHPRTASSRYPRPEERPDVYWTFTREAA